MRAFYFTNNPAGYIYAGALTEMTLQDANLCVRNALPVCDVACATCSRNLKNAGHPLTGKADPRCIWFVSDDLRELQLEATDSGCAVTYIYPVTRCRIDRPIAVEKI